MSIDISADLFFIVAVVFYVLALIPKLGKVPWVVLGHLAVAVGLLIAL